MLNEIQRIQELIFEIRGCRVMLDRDLAGLYGVPTKVLNQAVKRNIRRFPDDFMFKLSVEEMFQLVTICDRFAMLKHSSSTPYAFTEEGVAMLSGILKSDLAIDTNIKIMRAFVAYRRLATMPIAATYAELKRDIQDVRDYIEEILHDQNEMNSMVNAQLDAISTALSELQAKELPRQKPRRPIGFIVRDEE